MLAEGRTGLISAADGSVNPVRLDKTGAITIVSAHPLYSEASMRGNMYTASTAITGVAPGTTLSTTPPLSLWNPLNSDIDLSILDVSVGYVSGTLGAGCIVLALVAIQASVPSGGTELSPISNKLASIKGQARAFTGSTLSSTPIIVKPLFNLGAQAAATALSLSESTSLIEGSFTVPPGSAIAIQGVAAAGTTPLVIISMTWEEIVRIS